MPNLKFFNPFLYCLPSFYRLAIERIAGKLRYKMGRVSQALLEILFPRGEASISRNLHKIWSRNPSPKDEGKTTLKDLLCPFYPFESVLHLCQKPPETKPSQHHLQTQGTSDWNKSASSWKEIILRNALSFLFLVISQYSRSLLDYKCLSQMFAMHTWLPGAHSISIY